MTNGSEIDAKIMMGSKIAFWKHLGRLGSHLGATALIEGAATGVRGG